MADLCVIQKHEADIELIMDAVCLDNVHYCIENEDEYKEWLQES